MAKKRPTPPQKSVIFLPEHENEVAMLAMRGATDREIAETFGVSYTLLRKWRRMYPSLDSAIESGRTRADARVVAALHKKAIGYEYDEEVVIRAGEGFVDKTKLRKVAHPDTGAIKYWLNNRQKEHFADRTHTQVTGKAGEPAVALEVETKDQVMCSILNLISPKADPT